MGGGAYGGEDRSDAGARSGRTARRASPIERAPDPGESQAAAHDRALHTLQADKQTYTLTVTTHI